VAVKKAAAKEVAVKEMAVKNELENAHRGPSADAPLDVFGSHQFHGERLSLARNLSDRVATTEAVGRIPLDLHDALLGRETGATMATARLKQFRAAGRDFWWLSGDDSSDALSAQVDLPGHRLVLPDSETERSVISAIEHIASRPWAMELVGTFISTFAFTEPADVRDSRRLITSCSLPDFPLCVFFSERALVHIPPLTISSQPSVRLLAENLYHESVHQAVNYQLLSSRVLVPSYSSETSPKIPIYWREEAGEQRNRAWELDRVLHAAAVYCHLLAWRYHELRDPDLPAEDRAVIAAASVDAVGATRALCDALTTHISYFTSAGALLVGRLVEAGQTRSAVLSALLTVSGHTLEAAH
jgi:hypothetical protein